MCQVLMDLVSFVWRLLKPMWISRSKQSLRIKSTNCDPCLLLRDVIEWSIWCLHRQMWRHTIGKTAVPWAVQKCQLWFLPLGKLIDSKPVKGLRRPSATQQSFVHQPCIWDARGLIRASCRIFPTQTSKALTGCFHHIEQLSTSDGARTSCRRAISLRLHKLDPPSRPRSKISAGRSHQKNKNVSLFCHPQRPVAAPLLAPKQLKQLKLLQETKRYSDAGLSFEAHLHGYDETFWFPKETGKITWHNMT